MLGVTTYHLDKVEHLVASGADINTRSTRIGTALHAAVQAGDIEVAMYLLTNGVDVNASCESLGTALHVATYSELGREHRSDDRFITLLLAHGADVNSQCDSRGTALHVAMRSAGDCTIDILLRNGADINIQCKNHGTALDTAIRFERYANTRYLLRYGINNGLWTKNDIGKILKRAAELYAHDGCSLRVVMEQEFLRDVTLGDRFDALTLAARRDRYATDLVLALLEHLPARAFFTPEFDRLLQATDVPEKRETRSQLEHVRDKHGK
jgi:ankyrin repeat protein